MVVVQTYTKQLKAPAQIYINQLAEELKTKVTQKKDLPGMMYVEYDPPAIEGPLLRQVDTPYYPDVYCRFMVMLHELGHVHHGHTQGRPPYSDKTFYFDNGVLRSEAQAWEYALDQFESFCEEQEVEFGLTTVSRKFMWERCLGSYYTGSKISRGGPSRLGNGNRHHIEFTYDEPDDYFWSIKERILNG